MKEYFRRMKAKIEKKIAEARKKASESDNIEEVRALGDTLQGLYDDLKDVEAQLKAIEEGEGEDGDGEGAGEGDGARQNDGEGEGDARSAAPLNQRNLIPLASFATVNKPEERSDDVLDSMEYRKAFADYVRTGVFKMEKRADEIVTTEEIGKVIPNTVMQEFIKELKVYGNLYNRVRKLNVRGGVEFPIEDLIPTVKWITETTVSDDQKAPTLNTSVSFGYYIAEAKIAQSLLSSIVSLEILESEIAKILAEAFIKEFDRMIVNGSGSGQPTGVLNDKRVKAENKLTFTAAEMADWKSFRTKLFAKVPLAYRAGGVLLMTVETWESYIMTLKDDQNRPVYSETYDPVTGETICRFAGKEVMLVEPDILKDFSTAVADDAFAVYMKPENYAINSNLQIGFKRYFDEDKNKWVNKGLTILDGKLLDVNGVFILKKAVSA